MAPAKNDLIQDVLALRARDYYIACSNQTIQVGNLTAHLAAFPSGLDEVDVNIEDFSHFEIRKINKNKSIILLMSKQKGAYIPKALLGITKIKDQANFKAIFLDTKLDNDLDRLNMFNYLQNLTSEITNAQDLKWQFIIPLYHPNETTTTAMLEIGDKQSELQALCFNHDGNITLINPSIQYNPPETLLALVLIKRINDHIL
ncbi:hypothetical protein TrispH2_004079 [Trichoplax sp. H2]|nr:hypothetical protein TrispH2_004079 [Trichoplax sp. H2]|eukprot:RDD43030.1 hypothetical protein TrispH2_004079 [Trichoplax sp. H2]